jgi:hypothetical protein
MVDKPERRSCFRSVASRGCVDFYEPPRGVCTAAIVIGCSAYGGDRFSTEFVRVEIGAGYLIPRNHIVSIAPD